MPDSVLPAAGADASSAVTPPSSLLLTVLQQLPAAVATLEGPDHHYAFFNDYYAALTGHRARLGQAVATVLPELVTQGFVALLDDVYRTGTPFVASEMPVRLGLRDDEPPEQFLDFRYEPLCDAAGQVTGILVFVLDATERVLARRQTEALRHELHQSDEELRLQAESIPQQLWTATPDGTMDYYNHRTSEYLGEGDAWRGLDFWLEHLHPDDRASAQGRWAEALANGHYYETEFRLRRYDGQYRWFLAQAQARYGPEGQVLRWYGTNTDIEDQKRAQRLLVNQNARLTRTNQDLDNFVYTASHDLKQPINNMAGIFEELTRTAYFRDPDAVLLVGMFDRALKQIYSTIEGLTTIVQVQRQQHELAEEEIDLAALAEEVIGSVQEQVSQQHATFELDFAACATVLYARTNLQSIFYNLISNALKYADPARPPHIRLACAPNAHGRPVLTVQDNGLGIDLARFGPKLFQIFQRFHPQVEGSGMGLYLVNRIVQQHGGRIDVDSRVGEGTTFKLTLK